MTQPTNVFETYQSKSIREDLADVIYNVTPDETPLLSSLAQVKASQTYHEWQVDSLRQSGNNFHLEGDNTAGDLVNPTIREGNYSQIFKNAATISGTDQSVTNAGKGKELAYQLIKTGSEQKLDMEKAIMANVARVAGATGTPRKLGGLGAWLKTNVTNIGGSGGANPTGSIGGATARTNGTQTVFNQTKFDTCMQSVWENGGKPNMVILSAFQMSKALGFVGNNNQRSTGASGKVENLLNVYVTPWGNVSFVPARENQSRDVWIIESNKLAIASLRPMKQEALAKTGDSETRQVVTECTLVVRNEKALGLVADCSTS
jgi:hypothetical protein